MILGWCVSLASAAEPVITVTDAGAVRGTVFVAAAPEPVLALLRDAPARIATIGSKGSTVSTEPDGDCELEHSFSPHPIAPVKYTIRTCRTGTGLKSSLVSSDTLARFEAVWEVAATDGGSTVVYTLDAVPAIPIPSFVARMSTKAGVADALSALSRHFAP